jgi:hypothetical protein
MKEKTSESMDKTTKVSLVVVIIIFIALVIVYSLTT